MQSIHLAEDHSARTLTGAAVLSRIKLTGWGGLTAGVTALEDWTDRGRLWWKYTQSSGEVELFKRPTMLSGDRVCHGEASNGRVSLAADTDNSSPVSGSADIEDGTPGTNPAADANGDLIVSYAHENDLRDVISDVEGFLDEDSQWYDQDVRFEALLRRAKRMLDEMLVEKLLTDLGRDTAGRRILAAIADPRQLADVHALQAAGIIQRHRANNDSDLHAIAESYFQQARNLLRTIRIGIDDDADGVIDKEPRTANRTLLRM